MPAKKFDACIAAVAHKEFEGLDILGLLKEKYMVSEFQDVADLMNHKH